MLAAKVKKTIRKYSLLKPGDRIVVAVSGGPDSVCLLAVLHALSDEQGLSLHVAHLDHMFRGTESADEALFVQDLAERMDLPATVERIDVPAFCRERGLSSQAGAREARYAFLRRIARETGSTRIATGHTADDQAETFLMRLLRGAGLSGLSAIPPVRDMIIRPLLEVTREEVLAYLETSGCSFKTDPSNAEPTYTRNRIRLEVLPVLKRFNPRIVETLAAEAELLRDEEEANTVHCAALENDILTQNNTFVFLKRKEFNVLAPAFKRRLLKTASGRAGVASSDWSRSRIEGTIAFMATAQTGRTMNLPNGLAIEREYERFVLGVRTGAEDFSQSILLPGVTMVPRLLLEVETLVVDRFPADGEAENKIFLWQALFDYDKIGPVLSLRSRRAGDWFCPAGMGGRSKKLQDFFVDEKIPRARRAATPLLCSGKDILWVVGLRTDERFLPGPETRSVLLVQVRTARQPLIREPGSLS